MGDPRASFAAGSASTEPMSAPGDSVGGVHKGSCCKAMNLPPSMGLSGEGPKRLFGGKSCR